MFMVTTVLVSCGKGVNYRYISVLTGCIPGLLQEELPGSCYISVLTGCIPGLLQEELPGSAKHESAISVEVHGT